MGIKLTFRRKPTGEKSSTEGGLQFVLGDSADGKPVLLVTRISEGQSIAKAFSERALVRALLRDLEKLPSEVGSVSSVFNNEMLG